MGSRNNVDELQHRQGTWTQEVISERAGLCGLVAEKSRRVLSGVAAHGVAAHAGACCAAQSVYLEGQKGRNGLQ